MTNTGAMMQGALVALNSWHAVAQAKLEDDNRKMRDFLEKHAGTELGDLASRILTWPEMHVYSVFNTVFDVADKANYVGFLYSFLVNVFLDDSYYVVRWELPYDENFELKFDGKGDLIYFPSSREDGSSMPHVYWTGDGSCSVSELMEVMDEFERREALRAATFAE